MTLQLNLKVLSVMEKENNQQKEYIQNLQHSIKYYQYGLKTENDENEAEELIIKINHLQNRLNWELIDINILNLPIPIIL